MALFLYAVTLFISAFLLFLVQPIIGQKILPKLGGTPSVWNTCVVFFQLTLLVGYAYTHFTSKLPVKRQIMIHCLLLLVPFLFLFMPMLLGWPDAQPFYVDNFMPPPGANPITYTLYFLAIIVGVPFFVVSTTAPLLQKWFGSTGHPAAKDPYFLYGASNLGSMMSLLLYPPVFEPLFGLRMQSWIYTVGYIGLVAIVIGCGALAFMAPPTVQLPGRKKEEEEPEKVPSLAPEPPPEPAPSADQITTPAAAPNTAVTSAPPPPKPTTATGFKKGGKKGKQRDLAKMAGSTAVAPAATAAALAAAPPPTPSIARTAAADPDELTWARRFRWIGLAAVPSSFMLGVTAYMSTDIAAIPLFWVLPLALYLLSFILVFMRWPINWLEQAHNTMLYLQPALLALLVLAMAISRISDVVYIILIMLLAFMATCLVCHGEMAKDRPSSKHLTEFYLMMSVGGAVGGLFNGILAPVIFPWGVVEFGLALTVAGLLRPTLWPMGWIEWMLGGFSAPADSGYRPGKGSKKITRTANPAGGLTLALDVGIPLFFLAFLGAMLWLIVTPHMRGGGSMLSCVIFPLVMAGSFFDRPLRFGLTLGAVLFLNGWYNTMTGSVLYQTRSYFGVLRVQQGSSPNETYGGRSLLYISLTHGTTHHGMAFQPAEGIPDFSRLATTYYHRQGPAGICMERFNWFDKEYDNNSFLSDHRLPAALVGFGTPSLGINVPMNQLVGAWSSPSYAVIGMGTATMSSYAHPYQICHFFEIDNQIRLMSLPEPGGETWFGYVQAGLKRGANIKILMGDARLRMALPWVPENDVPDGPNDDPLKSEQQRFKQRGGAEYYYHLMVVDAFSSDAIPRHLINKEAITMYFKHLVKGHWGDWIKVDKKDKWKDLSGQPIDSISPKLIWEDRTNGEFNERRPWYPGGVLCVHTSNRHLELVPVVVDSAAEATLYDNANKAIPHELGKSALVAWRGHDSAPGHNDDSKIHEDGDIGHTNSEWVIVARDPKDLSNLLRPPSKYQEWFQKGYPGRDDSTYWTQREPTPNRAFLWTDDYSSIMKVLRGPWNRGGH